MRILFLIDSLKRGGKERQLIELLKGLDSNPDYQTMVGIMQDKNEIEYKEIFSLKTQIVSLPRKKKIDLSILGKIYLLCKSFKPNIIHTWDSMTSLFAIPSILLYSIPMINGSIRFAANNISANRKLNFLYRLGFLFSKRVIANSNAGLKTFLKNINTKYRVIYNGFDVSRIKQFDNKSEIKKQIGIKNEKIIGMVASFEDHKDNMTFVNCARKMTKEFPNVIFLSIGDGKNFKQIKESAKDITNIKFLGRIENVESVVNICDIGVLTSQTGIYGEGIPNSLLEFYAFKKPVVGTNSGGTYEVIENGVTGFLIPPKSETELEEKLKYLMQNSDEAKEMGNNGYLLLKQKFELNRMVFKYMDLYNEFKIN